MTRDEVLALISGAERDGREELGLWNQRIGELPPEIGRLKKLKHIDLEGNGLTSLPAELFELESLERLDLRNNALPTLPPSIAKLKRLEALYVQRNEFSALPVELARCTKLKTLGLDGRQLSSLPPEIAQLQNLSTLDLRSNQLSSLPPEVAQLQNLSTLDLQNNQLPEEYQRPWSELRTYLASLAEGEPLYEAKLLLVGEGDVGKTCLSKAMRAAPGTWSQVFNEKSQTTPGIKIDIGSLKVPNSQAGSSEPISINIWDFGGQERYYITHQFFFSPRTLYCLVWRPRKGHSAGNVEEWMERIERRVPNARVLVISTHCDEPGNPELDEGDLQSKFGEMIAGFHAIDNKSGTGIPELLEAIGKEASGLEQMGRPFNPRWKAVRDEALGLAGECPELTRDAVDEMAKKQGLSDDDTDVLLDLLHDLGRVVYYRHDEGLRDRVVINPEWLTQAIGYVLNDEVTIENNGELLHSRLDDIWRKHGNEAKEWIVYERKYHPFFLRLMEKFDISYRLPDRPTDKLASLVAQSVEFKAPALPWKIDTTLAAGQKELSLICEMDHRPDGLMAWMTVRNHRFAREHQRSHWRYGVFLSDLGQEALVLSCVS